MCNNKISAKIYQLVSRDVVVLVVVVVVLVLVLVVLGAVLKKLALL
jgi:hypothetical protein